MFTRKFGVEVEFTGITWKQRLIPLPHTLTPSPPMRAATMRPMRSEPDRRVWKFRYDGSIHCQRKKENRRLISTDSQYSVEMVTPILRYRGGY